MHKLLTTIFLLSVMAIALSAQDTLRIIAKSTQASESELLVRWVPANYATWESGIANGYTVVRYTVAIEGQYLNTDDYAASRVDIGPLTVASETDWTKEMEKEEEEHS